MPYLQNATHEGFIFNEATKAEFLGNGVHAAMAMRYFVANLPTGQLDGNNQPIYANYNIGQAVGLYSSNGTGANLTEIYLDPVKLAITAKETELSNVTVWSANSILTQGRANSLYIADTTAVLVPVSYGNDLFYGQYQTRHASPGFPFVAGGLLTNSRGIVGVSNTTDPCNIEFHPGESFNQMRFRSYDKSIVINNDGFSVETGTANWTWSANSILTQGRGDARYQNATNNTYANLTGKPTFATVATSGSYTDLANTPNLSLYLTTANAAATYLPSANFTYANIGGTIPTATNTTLGAVKVGSNLTIANGVLSATSSGGFQNGDTLNGGTY